MIDITFKRELAIFIDTIDKSTVTIRIADKSYTLRAHDTLTYDVNLEYHE